MTGKIRLHLGLCDAAGLLRESLDMVRPAIDAKSLRLDTSIGGPQLLLGDRDRLRQVLWNLFTNAVKFTPSGGLVAVWVERVGASIRITVRDTGIGIRRKAIPYIFHRFWQAENTMTREPGGLGLGLALSRYLVELHGGTIAVESAGPGMGAEFCVELPVRHTLKPGDVEGGSPSLDRLSNDCPEDSWRRSAAHVTTRPDRAAPCWTDAGDPAPRRENDVPARATSTRCLRLIGRTIRPSASRAYPFPNLTSRKTQENLTVRDLLQEGRRQHTAGAPLDC